MAVKTYASVNGQSKELKKIYGSVGGVSKKIKKLYASVNGVSKLIYSAVDGPSVTVTQAASAPGDTCKILLYAPGSTPSIRQLSCLTPSGTWIDPISYNYLSPGEYSFEVPANAVQGSTFHVLMRPPGVTIAFNAYALGTYDTVVE